MDLFFLSAAVLLFEIDLSRLFSVAQFYHFAFMVVSLALLGSGASGTILSIFPSLASQPAQRSAAWLALACGFSLLGAYWLTNALPFDSFSIAWDRRQVFILVLHYLALSLPFFLCGTAVGLYLSQAPRLAGRIYARSLLGSAAGCALALVAPAALGGEGVVSLSAGLALFAAVLASQNSPSIPVMPGGSRLQKAWGCALLALAAAGLALVSIDLGLRHAAQPGLPFMALRLSPYKGLSYALQQPGSRVEWQRWNAYSRLDIVSSPAIHSFPGLSYRYLQPLPVQGGLLVDGDDLSPLVSPQADLDFSAYLPGAAALELRPGAKTLVLGGRGGLDTLAALAQGAQQVDVVEANPLITASAPIYRHPQVHTIPQEVRSFLRSASNRYSVILLPLNASFHPVRSGAYSLVEDYRYTLEAFSDTLARLDPDGILLINRWLQNPPSEDLRAFALAAAALERQGLASAPRLAAFRGFNTVTILVKPQPFTSQEMDTLRRFTEQRAYDLVIGPGVEAGETDVYNVLSRPLYYETYRALLDASPRQEFFAAYPFDVSPPSDDHPFFGHFFKWSQSRQVLADLGRTWQPFGGAGYFVILALLVLAILLAAGLILLPVMLAGPRLSLRQGGLAPSMLFFTFIGFGYLLVEIPLIQKFILFLGQPSLAMTTVLFTLLLFSGAGSLTSSRVPLHSSLGLLVLVLCLYLAALPALFNQALGLSLPLRLLLSIILAAPLGWLMGIPFPGMIRQVEHRGLQGAVPWLWAVNGSASVVAAVLAALLALTFGFTPVLWLGAACYAGAWLAASRVAPHGAAPAPVSGTKATPPML
jgi:hypothetical protein